MGILASENQCTGERAGNQHDALNCVCPHYSCNAAEEGVEQGYDSRRHDDGADIPAEHRVYREGEQQEYGTCVAELRQ